MTISTTPDQLRTTTRTVCKELDFYRPGPKPLIEECIELAIHAPAGSPRQTSRWPAIGDSDVRAAVEPAPSPGLDRPWLLGRVDGAITERARIVRSYRHDPRP